MKKRAKIYASLLAVHDGDVLKEWKRVERFVDGVHIDVADGTFVPQKTKFTPRFTKSLKTRKWKDVHLMVAQPEKYVATYIRAGAQEIDIHFETLKTPVLSLAQIKERFPRVKVYLAVNAETSARSILPVLGLVDGVLCMTQARPGKSGEKFVSSVLKKIRAIRAAAPRLPIVVDGGINAATARRARTAGATVLVSGSHIFHAEDPRVASGQLR